MFQIINRKNNWYIYLKIPIVLRCITPIIKSKTQIYCNVGQIMLRTVRDLIEDL
jgi:hypothetical protein